QAAEEGILSPGVAPSQGRLSRSGAVAPSGRRAARPRPRPPGLPAAAPTWNNPRRREGTAMLDRGDLAKYAERARGRFEDPFRRFVEVPSVSMDPDRKGDVRRMADLALETLRELGAEARLVETAGNPIVHGRFARGEGLPRVTVYNHLDVQP